MFSLFTQSQTQRDSVLLKSTKPVVNLIKKANNNGVYTFCDNDQDGLLSFDILQIKGDILSENASQIGFQGGVYICTNSSNVYMINDLSLVPQINYVCHVQGITGWSTIDIATNLNNELFVAEANYIHKIDSSTCQILSTYDYGLNDDDSVTSLSFDTSNNMYFGGFDSSVYRSSGDFAVKQLWHNFGSGYAAGDFVMYSGKMYIAWILSQKCWLYEVVLDANNNYISHVVLGELPNPTYGLASELGKLYGVHPDFLYEIDLNPFSTDVVLQNNSFESWYGSAGKNEGVNYSANAFETLNNAQNNLNPLPDTWTNTISGGQTIYVSIVNTVNGLSQIIPVDLVVNVPPSYVVPQTLNHCVNDLNSAVFDIRATENLIIGSQTNIEVTYHESTSDAVNNVNPLPDLYTLVGNFKYIYVRLYNTITGCSSYFSFDIKINPLPIFTQPSDLITCSKNGEPINNEVNLESQIESILTGLNENLYQVTFYHTSQNAISQTNPIETPYFITTNQEEIFFNMNYLVTGCSSIGSFMVNVLVEDYNFTESVQVEVLDWTYNQNSISIAVSGNDDYEYSLDGLNYESDSFFQNLQPGIYTAYVRNTSSCKVFSKEVYLLIYPNFFTPNADGINDYWRIKFSNYEPNIKIFIYDRFGRLLKELDNNSSGWDGIFNNQQLPSSDYWFLVRRESGIEYRGHFTLKR